MRRRKLFKLFTDAGCVFIADKKEQRGMLRAISRHQSLPGYPWKDTDAFKLHLLNLRKFRALYGFIKKKTLRRMAKKASRLSFVREVESRVDIILSRSGLIPNVWKARQLIRHGHVRLNRCQVTQPSQSMRPGDILEISREYLKTQIGNPEGDDIPNKKHYDPRKWLREGERTFKDRLKKSFEDLNNINTL